jgi:hypothetical protein
MQVKLADGVTTVRIDHPPVNAFDLGLVEDAVATVRLRVSQRAQVIARQLISMLSPSRTGKLTLT